MFVIIKSIKRKVFNVLLAFILVFLFSGMFQNVSAVNKVYQLISDDGTVLFREYANLYGKPEKIGKWQYPWGNKNGVVFGDYPGGSYLNTYNQYALRIDKVENINTNYRPYTYEEDKYKAFYDRMKPDMKLSLNEQTLLLGIDEYLNTYFQSYSDPVIVSFKVPELNDGTYGPNRADLYLGMPAKNPLTILKNEVLLLRFQHSDENTYVADYRITKEGVELIKNAIGYSKSFRMSFITETDFDASKHNGILTGEPGSSAYSKRASGGMDTGWKAIAGMQGFGVDEAGSVFGVNSYGGYAKGKSVLNVYDNIMNINFNNQRKLLIRYADTSASNWKTIEGAENNNIKTNTNNLLTNELKYQDNSGDTASYNQALRAEGFREKYTYDSEQGLQVKLSDNVKYDPKTRKAIIYNTETKVYESYTYNGYHKYWGKTHGDTEYIGFFKDDSFLINAADQTDYTKIIFDFKKDVTKSREVYVNYIEEGSLKLLHSLSNSSQSGKSNQIAGSEGQGTYGEYYKFSTSESMTIRNSDKLQGGYVTIDGKKYQYTFMKTSSGYNLDAAWKNGGDKVPPQNGVMSYTIPSKDEIDTTIVSFYFKQVEDTNITDDIKIKGRLAFKTALDKSTCLDEGGIEYVPTDYVLQPYVEGAQRYLLPNINSETGKNLNGKNSYRQDYEPYYYIKITGISKANEGGCYSGFYNNYETTSLTGNSDPNSWMQESNNRKQPFHESMRFSIQEGGLSSPITINFSEYKNKSGNTWTFTHSSYETGSVMRCYTVTDDEGESHTYCQCESESVSVTYQITIERKYKLNSLPIYRIVNNTTKVNGISGDRDNTKVLDGGSSLTINTSDYYNNQLDKLKTYYEDYVNEKRDIPTPNQMLTTHEDFSTKFTIPGTKHNGIRTGTADIQYELFDYARKIKIQDSKNLPRGVSSVALNHAPILNKGYYDTESKTSLQNERINILTPIELATPEIISKDVVNHDEKNGKNSNVIQKDAPFKLTPKTTNSSVYGSLATENYVKAYYIKFDFEVSNLEVKNSGGGVVQRIQKLNKNTYVKVPRGGYIEGFASSGNIADIVGQFKNKIRIVAVATNARDIFENNQISLEQGLSNPYDTSYNNNSGYNNVYMDLRGTQLRDILCSGDDKKTYNGQESTDTGMTRDSRYIVFNDYDTYNIGRIYDFKITDCSDVNFKNVFRTYNDNNTVNQLTGKYYYSGIRKLVLGQLNDTNNLVPRTDIGNIPKTILPLGPYKNTSTAYIQAPKLGYRISFDVKTTGYFGNEGKNKYIEITPSYYYISKDGNTFIEDIKLYYKNNTGRYVPYENSNYNIQFKPNDGYRTKPNDYVTNELKYMSTKYTALNMNKLILNSDMMATSAERFVQSWYGEFKLPNSTLAMASDKTDLNKDRLKDGYIGVKFDIVAVETDDSGNTRRIAYNTKDKNSTAGINTTQWDYEGYLGYSGGGSEVNIPDRLNIQLERGIWQIDTQEKYEKVKSTVLLYDLDNRAASDFD